MQLTNRAKLVDRKPLSLAERLYVPAILKGMGITLKHMFQKKVTINYPEETRPFSPGLCAVACPAEAITMEAAERLPGEEHLYREEKYAAKYEINMLRCIFCGLCEEACPKDAIYLTETFAPSNYSRKSFIYGKENLVIPHPKDKPDDYAKAKGLVEERKQKVNKKTA